MIRIDTYPDELLITGHAGYAPPGYDIVCEAVTVLAQTLAESVRQLTNDSIETEIKTGYFRLSGKDLSEESKLLIRSFIVGVRLISGAYEEYIELTEH